MKRWLPWIGGLVLLAALGGYWLRGRLSARATEPKLEGDVARLRAEVRALRKGLALQRPEPPQYRLAPAAPEAVASAGSEEPADPDAFRRGLHRELIKDDMEVALNAQTLDERFGAALEAQLEQLYSHPEFEGTRLESVECSPTLCRIASQHDSIDARRSFGAQAAQHAPFDTEVFYWYGQGEPPTTTLYVARSGESLPRP